MRLASVVGLALGASSPFVVAFKLQEIPEPAIQGKYATGQVMDTIMAKKLVRLQKSAS